MTTLLVRDANENHRAQAILTGPRGHEISDVVYEGWPRLVFDSDVRLDLVRCAGNLEAARLAAEHNYCLIRYGSPDRRRMTDADRMAVRISAHFENDNHTIVIDLSNAMNGTAAAARARAAELRCGGNAHLFDGLLAANDDADAPKESVGRALREIGTAIVNRLSPACITCILLAGVVSFAVGWTCVGGIEANLEHAFKMKVQEDSQQLKMTELNARLLTGTDGKPVQLTPQVKQALAREDAEDKQRAAQLAKMELEHPLLRFVSAEAHDGLAATLDMAPDGSTIRINGMTMGAAMARDGAASLRRAAKAKRGWVTEVIPATDI